MAPAPGAVISLYSGSVPRNLKRYYGFGHLHFITFSCHQRLPWLRSHGRRDLFLRALEATRVKYGMTVVGYVVMPEHVHLLVSEPDTGDLSVAIKALKQGVTRRALRQVRRAAAQCELFANDAPRRFWQARFYDFNSLP
jgi:putative transposase